MSVKVSVEVGACKLENDGTSFSDYSYDVSIVQWMQCLIVDLWLRMCVCTVM